ncbi:MAG: tripartite tricarboxylate transporter substrate binding protein [Alphaproteobacteria bacterium]|nr:tripartite tricarboxylate transporter substrate binding protein [Alphaproteobacteria bacterium]
MIDRRTLLARSSALTGGLGLGLDVWAQPNWPNGPVKFVHGYPAGQTPDILARQIGPTYSELTGVPWVVDARPGGGERLAANQMAQLAKQAADGQTVYQMTGGLTVISAVDKSIQFDLMRDFTYVSMLTQYPFVFWVAANSPFKNLGDMIEFARKNPGKISYGTSGVGNTLHMSVELMSSMTDAKMTHIPYKGPTAYTDVAGGVLDMAVGTFAVGRALYREGRIRPLAVTSPKRWMEWTEIPAIAETVPGYEVVTWAALCVPGRVSNDIRDRLNKLTRDTLAKPDIVQKIEGSGAMAAPNSPDEMRQRVQNDIAKWKKVAEYAKIELS